MRQDIDEKKWIVIVNVHVTEFAYFEIGIQKDENEEKNDSNSFETETVTMANRNETEWIVRNTRM